MHGELWWGRRRAFQYGPRAPASRARALPKLTGSWQGAVGFYL
ncbi:hypothetical protein APY03_1142 [Variovorax sp. WDL1]|nr:hypothetical protein APY03_1142 [Variovorax sp. WDL1]